MRFNFHREGRKCFSKHSQTADLKTRHHIQKDLNRHIQVLLSLYIPYYSIDNARVIYTKKRSKFVKNEHARYTLGMKKGKNLERLITATSQARF